MGRRLHYAEGGVFSRQHNAATVVDGLQHPERTTFANGNVSDQEIPGETTIGPDISVGYMYRMNDRFGIDVRYRATVYFTINGPSSFDDARVNHGVSLGFTTWLGSR